jgi:hypothetical protein
MTSWPTSQNRTKTDRQPKNRRSVARAAEGRPKREQREVHSESHVHEAASWQPENRVTQRVYTLTPSCFAPTPSCFAPHSIVFYTPSHPFYTHSIVFYTHPAWNGHSQACISHPSAKEFHTRNGKNPMFFNHTLWNSPSLTQTKSNNFQSYSMNFTRKRTSFSHRYIISTMTHHPKSHFSKIFHLRMYPMTF